MRRRRAWVETLSHEELCRPATVELLRRFGIAPIVAFWPATPPAELDRVVAAFADAGLPAALWPMLADRDGRWFNAGNAEAFAAFVEAALGRLDRLPAELTLDLEPAIDDLRGSVAPAGAAVNAHFLPLSLDRRRFDAARARLSALLDALRARGIQVSAAAPPTALLDPTAGKARPFQELLGTPVDGLPWDHVSVMLYTSILEGWSRGILRREDARALLGAGARAAAERFGARAGVSVGAVGVGAFGDEPVYRGVEELADDVAIAGAAGVDELALFDLGGVLRRSRPEAWLEAFTQTPPALAVPPPTVRARAALAGARLAGGVLRYCVRR